MEIANYYLGTAFFEIFSNIKSTNLMTEQIDTCIKKSQALIKHPTITQNEADDIAIDLINQFLLLCINPVTDTTHKNIAAIHDELECLENNDGEGQEMSNTRFAIIFQEIASLLEGQVETLFSAEKKNG